ncbi:MAG: hypothetical protein H6671_04095 [Anaerolineaceae bacterium]|nr:hypothetical protein [Anaerolineaceae bacterium]
MAAFRPCEEINRRTGWRIFYGIFQQIDQHLLDQHTINRHQRQIIRQIRL